MKFWQIQEDMGTFIMDKNAVENKYFNWLSDGLELAMDAFL